MASPLVATARNIHLMNDYVLLPFLVDVASEPAEVDLYSLALRVPPVQDIVVILRYKHQFISFMAFSSPPPLGVVSFAH
jgi:hypothetical protein